MFVLYCATQSKLTQKESGELDTAPFSFPFSSLSLGAWLKSPLDELDLCCQATRLPGSRTLINSDSVSETGASTHGDGQEDEYVHLCKQI